MRSKEHMKLNFRRLYYHLKSIGILFFVPIVVIDVLLPILNFMEYYKYGLDVNVYLNILQYTQWLIPFFSVWWIILVLREYLESDGNEVLFVHANRCKLTDILFIFLAYIVNVIILYAVYTMIFPHMFYEFLKIISISFFYLGLVYFISFLTKSITITLMVTLLYTLAVITHTGENSFPFYYSLQFISLSLYMETCFPLVVTGALFLGMGVLLNYKTLKFV